MTFRCEPVKGCDIRVGDVLAFHPRPQETSISPPEKDCVVVHRVIGLLRVGEQTVFLTKGDDQPMFDPVVLPDQILSRVGRRRGWDRWIAEASYLQAMAHHRWMCMRHGRLNQLWRRGREKLAGLFRRSN